MSSAAEEVEGCGSEVLGVGAKKHSNNTVTTTNTDISCTNGDHKVLFLETFHHSAQSVMALLTKICSLLRAKNHLSGRELNVAQDITDVRMANCIIKYG